MNVFLFDNYKVKEEKFNSSILALLGLIIWARNLAYGKCSTEVLLFNFMYSGNLFGYLSGDKIVNIKWQTI